MPKGTKEIIEHAFLPYFENSKQFSYARLHNKGKQMGNAVASFISAKKFTLFSSFVQSMIKISVSNSWYFVLKKFVISCVNITYTVTSDLYR